MLGIVSHSLATRVSQKECDGLSIDEDGLNVQLRGYSYTITYCVNPETMAVKKEGRGTFGRCAIGKRGQVTV